MPPGGNRAWILHVFLTASETYSGYVRLAKCTATVYWRASILNIGGGEGKSVVFSAKSDTRRVADMIIRRSGYRLVVRNSSGLRERMNAVLTLAFSLPSFHSSSRRRTTLLSTPIKISVLTLRSCASSTMMTEYLLSEKSLASSRNKTPSVMNLIAVVDAVVVS